MEVDSDIQEAAQSIGLLQQLVQMVAGMAKQLDEMRKENDDDMREVLRELRARSSSRSYATTLRSKAPDRPTILLVWG